MQPAMLVYLSVVSWISILGHWRPATPDTRRVGTTDCVAPPEFEGTSGFRLWPEPGWQAGRDTTPRPPDEVAARLQGTYRLLLVTTEGAGAKWISEWTLVLAPTPPAQDSGWASRWSGRRVVHFPLSGTMDYTRGGYLNADGQVAPRADGWTPKAQRVRVRYEPKAGILGLDGAPFDMLDGGSSYAIYTVDRNGGFSGRWGGGGFVMSLIPTPFGNLAEQSKGYFCASRSSSP